VIERLVAWYRVTSSTLAVVALVVANLVPLAGVLWFGWSVWTILILYWLENGIVGIFNVLKIQKAEGVSAAPVRATINGRPVDASSRSALSAFFLMHYGMFWVVHGIFVLTLPLFSLAGTGSTEDLAADVRPGTIILALIALTISHGLSYWFNFIKGGEYLRVSPSGQMSAPYGRLVVLHLTIIVGAMAIGFTGAPEAAVAILVILKTVLDVGFHLAEHRKAAGRAAATEEPEEPRTLALG
jgi:hypothetical protein